MRENPCGLSSLRIESTERNTSHTAQGAAETLLRHSLSALATSKSPRRFPSPAVHCRHAAPQKGNRGAWAFQHPRLREYPEPQEVCHRDCRFRPCPLQRIFSFPHRVLRRPDRLCCWISWAFDSSFLNYPFEFAFFAHVTPARFLQFFYYF